MPSPRTIGVLVLTNSTPATGLLPSYPVFSTWKTSSNGTSWAPATAPTFIEVDGGKYEAVVDDTLLAALAGKAVSAVIDCGPTADVRYLSWDARAEDWNTDRVDAASSLLATAAAVAEVQDSLSALLAAFAGLPAPTQLYGAARGFTFASAFAHPFEADVTAAIIEAAGAAPFATGDDFLWRNQVRAPGGAATQDLTGFVVIITITDDDGQLIMSRRSDTDITLLPGTKQVAIDAGQTTANLLTDETGRGWWEMRVYRAEPQPVPGMYNHAVDLQRPDGMIEPYLRGRFQVID